MAESHFEHAVYQHQRRVHTLASYLLDDPAEAEDVTQEVLIRLWRNRSMVGSDGLAPWLLRVTRNACIDRLRLRRSRARFVAAGVTERTAGEVACDGPGPEDMALGSEYSARLRVELSRLPEVQRSVVILREIQGLSYREIGAVLDLPVATVRVSLHRARGKLRERMKGVMAHASSG